MVIEFLKNYFAWEDPSDTKALILAYAGIFFMTIWCILSMNPNFIWRII